MRAASSMKLLVIRRIASGTCSLPFLDFSQHLIYGTGERSGIYVGHPSVHLLQQPSLEGRILTFLENTPF
jgi:hypothetical protein